MSRAPQPATRSHKARDTQEDNNSFSEDEQQPVDAAQQGPATRRSQKKWGELPPDGATAARFCKAFWFTMGDVPADGWCAGAALVASYWNSLLVQQTERRNMVSDWNKLELVPCGKPPIDQLVECYLRDMMTLLVERALFLESCARSSGGSLMQEPPTGYGRFVCTPRSQQGLAPRCLDAIPDGGLPMYVPRSCPPFTHDAPTHYDLSRALGQEADKSDDILDTPHAVQGNDVTSAAGGVYMREAGPRLDKERTLGTDRVPTGRYKPWTTSSSTCKKFVRKSMRR